MPDGDSEVTPSASKPPEFTESTSAEPGRLSVRESQLSQYAVELAGHRVQEVKNRIAARKDYAKGFFLLLIAQNVLLTIFIGAEAQWGDLASLGPLVIGIGSATLIETAAIVQIVVRWMFAEIDYSEKPTRPDTQGK
jgi:hypothetical protein